jgi:hypothetical protein
VRRTLYGDKFALPLEVEVGPDVGRSLPEVVTVGASVGTWLGALDDGAKLGF